MFSRFINRSLAITAALSVYADVAYAEELRIQAIDVQLNESGALANITLDQTASGSAVSAFVLESPQRIAVDIADARVADDLAQNMADNPFVSQIEVQTFDENEGLLTRVTFHVTDGVEHQLSTNGNVVSLEIQVANQIDDPLADALGGRSTPPAYTGSNNAPLETPLSGPNNLVDGPTLTSLDFDQQDSFSRIVIGLKGTDNYSESRPRTDTILIDIPNAFVPRSLSRVLDTSRFFTPVKMVRAYRTSSGARIAINLRGNPEYSVSQSADGFLFVDIVIPESMRQEQESARQAAVSVSPEGPEEGISNA